MLELIIAIVIIIMVIDLFPTPEGWESLLRVALSKVGRASTYVGITVGTMFLMNIIIFGLIPKKHFKENVTVDNIEVRNDSIFYGSEDGIISCIHPELYSKCRVQIMDDTDERPEHITYTKVKKEDKDSLMFDANVILTLPDFWYDKINTATVDTDYPIILVIKSDTFFEYSKFFIRKMQIENTLTDNYFSQNKQSNDAEKEETQ